MNLYDIATADLAWAGSTPTQTSVAADGIREETTRFDNFLGQGFYHNIYLDDLHIGYGDLRPAQSLRLRSQRSAPTLELHFLLEGTCISQLDTPGPALLFQGGESNLLFLPEAASGRHEIAAGQTCREFEVHLSGPYLQRVLQGGGGALATLAHGRANNTVALLHQQHLPISPPMRQLMQQIVSCSLQGLARRFFLEAKVLELLALHLAQEVATVPKLLRLRGTDIEKLHAARALLLQDVSQAPTLPQLAVLAGLNECKLKQGFRQLFGDTVYGCLLNCKLEKARAFLQQGNMTVAEVAEAVGYRHASHFTTAFKKKYGVLPKNINLVSGEATC